MMALINRFRIWWLSQEIERLDGCVTYHQHSATVLHERQISLMVKRAALRRAT
jgi:hypothetical protein